MSYRGVLPKAIQQNQLIAQGKRMRKSVPQIPFNNEISLKIKRAGTVKRLSPNMSKQKTFTTAKRTKFSYCTDLASFEYRPARQLRANPTNLERIANKNYIKASRDLGTSPSTLMNVANQEMISSGTLYPQYIPEGLSNSGRRKYSRALAATDLLDSTRESAEAMQKNPHLFTDQLNRDYFRQLPNMTKAAQARSYAEANPTQLALPPAKSAPVPQTSPQQPVKLDRKTQAMVDDTMRSIAELTPEKIRQSTANQITGLDAITNRTLERSNQIMQNRPKSSSLTKPLMIGGGLGIATGLGVLGYQALRRKQEEDQMLNASYMCKLATFSTQVPVKKKSPLN